MSEGPISVKSTKVDTDMDADLAMLGRSDALRKLVSRDHANSQGGTSTSPLPSSSSPALVSSIPPKIIPPKTASSSKPYDFNAIRANVPGSKYTPAKGEPISLAAFMGSSASGPRLNKAPKQEEYDPTLYAPRPDISGPHPIFGRARDAFEKGKPLHNSITHIAVPLPGLARKSSPQLVSDETYIKSEPFDEDITRDNEPDTKFTSVDFTSKDTRSETPPPNFPPPSQVRQASRTPSPVKANERREDAFTTPVRATPTTNYDEFGSPSSNRIRVFGDRSPAPSSSKPLMPSPVGLARPIQPTPNPAVSPQVAASVRQSPAFLKAPQQKELTPSLSRLQGRGFVAQRISASEVLDAIKEPVGSPTLGKKGGVLSRWPPASNDNAAGKFPEPSPESPTRARALSQIERDREAGVFPGTNTPPPRRQQSQPRLGPGAVPLPAMTKSKSQTAPPQVSRIPEPEPSTPPPPPVALPGLAAAGARAPGSVSTSASQMPASSIEVSSSRVGPGSASTMISYIRPQKTGQSERSVRVKGTGGSEDDEPDRGQSEAESQSQLEAEAWRGSTSKSVEPAPVLTHPTKDRARKPQAMMKKKSEVVDKMEAKHLEKQLSGDEDIVVLHRPQKSSDRNAGMVSESAAAAGPEKDNVKGAESDATCTPTEPSKPVEIKDSPKVVEQSTEPASPATESLLPPPSPDDKRPPRRSSIIEKYSAIILPSVPEEALQEPPYQVNDVIPPPEPESPPWSAKDLEKEAPESSSSSDNEEPIKNASIPSDDIIVVEQEEEPTRVPEIWQFLNVNDGPFKPNTSFQPISTEAFALKGSQPLVSLDLKPLIVYDTECVAVVYRVKSRATGLASTKVFAWMGKSWQENPAERRKLHELAGRYSAPLIHCSQGSESGEFLYVIGNIFVSREGSRGHWSIDNTTMHRVRRLYGCVMVDELPFHIGNLCAGFSYILSMLGTLYVWHGKGTLKAERVVASNLGQQMKGETELVELRQGKEDQTFWMMLGDDFNSADYWRHRDERNVCDPRVFEVVTDHKGTIEIQYRPRFCGLNLTDNIVILVDCSFELFIVIGAQARDKRKPIKSILTLAKSLSKASPLQRPFPPPIHIIVLPSQLPAELRMALRFVPTNDETNPQQMNILTLDEAIQQLGTPSWIRSQLSDESFLPLGISPAML